MACPIETISLNMSIGYVTAASTGGSGVQLYTRTNITYESESWKCLVCTENRAGYYILDNHEGNHNHRCPALSGRCLYNDWQLRGHD